MRSIGRGIVVEERERGEVRDISPSRTAGGRVIRAGGAAIVRLAIMPFRAGRVDLEQEYLEHRGAVAVASWQDAFGPGERVVEMVGHGGFGAKDNNSGCRHSVFRQQV